MTEGRDLVAALTALFDETEKAHHPEFLDANGEDPEWAEWYARHTREKIEALLGIAIPESDLAVLLADVEERRGREGGPPWAAYYARFFVERFGE